MIAYMNVLQNSQQGIQYLLNVSCACRNFRAYGVCVNHASGQKKRAGTSKDKLCRRLEVIVIIKNDESKS